MQVKMIESMLKDMTIEKQSQILPLMVQRNLIEMNNKMLSSYYLLQKR